MRRILLPTSLLALVAAYAIGADPVEVAEAVTDEGGGIATWLTALATGVAALFGWLFTILRKKFGADTEKAAIDKEKTLWEQKNMLIDQRITPFAISTGEHWVLTNTAPIMIDALDGNGFKWSDHFDDLKAYVKDRVLKKFATENIDILEYLAENELNDLLDRILVKTITFLPESVQKLIPDSVAEKAGSWAADFLKEKGKDLISK